jgi:uncharacterized membrane protein
MKVLRFFLIALGIILVISQMLVIIMTFNKPWVFDGKALGFFDYYFIPILAIFIGGLLLFFAYRISKKLKKKKTMDLINSLPQ